MNCRPASFLILSSVLSLSVAASEGERKQASALACSLTIAAKVTLEQRRGKRKAPENLDVALPTIKIKFNIPPQDDLDWHKILQQSAEDNGIDINIDLGTALQLDGVSIALKKERTHIVEESETL